MTKPVLGDSFEELEEIPRQVVKQAANLPGAIVKTALTTIVGKNNTGKTVDPLTGLEVPDPKKIKQIRRKEARLKRVAVSHLMQTLQTEKTKKKPLEKLPAYIAGKPGMTEEKLAQMQGLTPQKKELPPPVMVTKRKFSTQERKLGISG